MSVGAVLLWPLTMVYRAVMMFRNYLYQQGYQQSYRFEIPVIGLGNLNVGGTGKTPATEYLIKMLKDKHRIAVVSRGYGRKTSGLLFANPRCDAAQLGDEPYQMYKKYGHYVHVVVGEDRVVAMRAVMNRFPDVSVILLDDAYQHRRVTLSLNILLTEFSKPFYCDYVLPSGRLREARTGAARADGIVVTKCPEWLTHDEKRVIEDRITQYAGQKAVFFAHIQYGSPQPFWGTEPMGQRQKVVLLSGIARPALFESYARQYFDVLEHVSYPDHYPHTPRSLGRVVRRIQQHGGEVSLLTTEKDMVKLLSPIFEPMLSRLKCHYVPIEMAFGNGEHRFDEWVLKRINIAQVPVAVP